MLTHTLLKEGSGIPLVFLHGFLGVSQDWEGVISHLPKVACIGVDLPGHGTSLFSPVFTLDLPYSHFHLIGYSMGGRLALQYAIQNPHRIASLTLLSAHPGFKTEEEKRKRLEKDTHWANLLQTLSIDAFLKLWYSQPLFQTLQPNWDRRRQQNPKELAQALLHYSLGKQIHCLPFLPKNTQALIGEWDVSYHTLYPNPIFIEKAGHSLHLENPQAVAHFLKTSLSLKD